MEVSLLLLCFVLFSNDRITSDPVGEGQGVLLRAAECVTGQLDSDLTRTHIIAPAFFFPYFPDVILVSLFWDPSVILEARGKLLAGNTHQHEPFY